MTLKSWQQIRDKTIKELQNVKSAEEMFKWAETSSRAFVLLTSILEFKGIKINDKRGK